MNYKVVFILAICLGFSCSEDDIAGNGQLPEVEGPFMPTCYEPECSQMVPYFPFLIRDDAGISMITSQSTPDPSAGECSPDFFEVYTSVDNVNFELFGTFDREERPVSIPHFNSGELQYLKLINKHCELADIESKTLMTSGDQPSFVQEELDLPNFVQAGFSISSDDRYLAYNEIFNWSYFDLNNTSNPIALEPGSKEVIWAKEAPVLYYISSTEGICNGIKSLNVETGVEQELLDLSGTSGCSIKQIALDNDENILIYSSDEGTPDPYTNLWFLDLNTLEKERMTDLPAIEFVLGKFVVDPVNDNNIYVNKKYAPDQNEFISEVYRFDVSVHALEAVLAEDQFDELAAISPDGNTLIFHSRRTGGLEYWSYHLATDNLVQLSNFTLSDDPFQINGGLGITDENKLLFLGSKNGQKSLVSLIY